MSDQQTPCPHHGRQDAARACIHVATAIVTGEQVGFHWGDNAPMGRPDAWCHACEQRVAANRGEWSDALLRQADFKTLCVKCWDEAKRILYG